MDVSIYFHRSVHLLPLNLPSTSMQASIYFHRRPSIFHESITSIYVYGSSVYFHGVFHLLPWKLPSTSMEASIYFHLFKNYASFNGVAAASMQATDYFHLLPSTCMQLSSTSSFLDVPAWYPDPPLDLISFRALLPLTNSSGAEM